MLTITGVVESVGLMLGIRLASGSLVFAPHKDGMRLGQKVGIIYNVKIRRLGELKEMLKKGGFDPVVEALLLCYDPDADYSGEDCADLGFLCQPCEGSWNPITGVSEFEWYEDDEVIVVG